jgi:hypothetical protein
MEIDPQELANREADIRGNTTDQLTREIPDSANLSRSWALLDFFQALQSNVTAWIKKVEHTGLRTLAVHGDDVLGSDGAKAEARA